MAARPWWRAAAAALAVVALAGCSGGTAPAAGPSPVAGPGTPAASTTPAPAAADPDGMRPAPLRPVTAVGDEFADAAALSRWRLGPGEAIDGAAPRASVAGGMLTIVSAHSAWIGTNHGFGLARRTTGDFTATLRVRPAGLRSAVPTVDWSLTGLMVRAPTTDRYVENWVHLSAGYVGRPVVERKDTVASHSELVVKDATAGWIELRIVRSGPALVLLHRAPDRAWVFDHTYLRPDLPPTVELLLTTQSGAESDHADLVSTIDWLRVTPIRLRATLREGDAPPPAAVLAALTAQSRVT